MFENVIERLKSFDLQRTSRDFAEIIVSDFMESLFSENASSVFYYDLCYYIVYIRQLLDIHPELLTLLKTEKKTLNVYLTNNQADINPDFFIVFDKILKINNQSSDFIKFNASNLSSIQMMSLNLFNKQTFHFELSRLISVSRSSNKSDLFIWFFMKQTPESQKQMMSYIFDDIYQSLVLDSVTKNLVVPFLDLISHFSELKSMFQTYVREMGSTRLRNLFLHAKELKNDLLNDCLFLALSKKRKLPFADTVLLSEFLLKYYVKNAHIKESLLLKILSVINISDTHILDMFRYGILSMDIVATSPRLRDLLLKLNQKKNQNLLFLRSLDYCKLYQGSDIHNTFFDQILNSISRAGLDQIYSQQEKTLDSLLYFFDSDEKKDLLINALMKGIVFSRRSISTALLNNLSFNDYQKEKIKILLICDIFKMDILIPIPDFKNLRDFFDNMAFINDSLYDQFFNAYMDNPKQDLYQLIFELLFSDHNLYNTLKLLAPSFFGNNTTPSDFSLSFELLEQHLFNKKTDFFKIDTEISLL